MFPLAVAFVREVLLVGVIAYRVNGRFGPRLSSGMRRSRSQSSVMTSVTCSWLSFLVSSRVIVSRLVTTDESSMGRIREAGFSSATGVLQEPRWMPRRVADFVVGGSVVSAYQRVSPIIGCAFRIFRSTAPTRMRTLAFASTS